jgi:serine protease Do
MWLERKYTWAAIGLACLAVAPSSAVAAYGDGHGRSAGVVLAAGPAPAAPSPPPEKPTLDVAKAVELAIERAADQVGPAVVNILVMREAGGGFMGMDDPEGGPDNLPDGLKEFFEKYRRAPPPSFRAQGNGSGVIISPDGFILTSEHVVRDSSEIEVTLATRKRYRAKVVGSDARRDLAVIRIDAAGLPAAKLGDASALRRGQFVLALGSPFGFGRDGQASISFGIVSGTGRAIPGIGRELDRYYGNLIQTDAAVNPGNSGGPLANLDGEVVGVSAVISSQTGASDGVGFAVPITAQTRAIVERLKRGEEIVYGYIGVLIQEVGEEEAKASGAEVGQGALVSEVVPDAPGAKAGVREGDVVVGIGDTPVRDPNDVIQLVQATPVGEKVTLVVLRKGKREKMTVEVARRPGPVELAGSRETGAWWRGMRVEPLTADLREQIGLKDSDQGVFVREVRDGSAAAKAGISPGMVLDQVSGKKVASIKDFIAAVAKLDGSCAVRIVGIGTKTIPAPEAPKSEKPDAKEPKPDKLKDNGGEKKPDEKPAEKPEPSK